MIVVLKVNIWWMIRCDMLKFLFVWNFQNKMMSRIYSNIFWHSTINCVIKTRELFIFLPLINNSVAIEFSFLILSILGIITSKMIKLFRFLIWVVFFNVSINIIHIIWIFNKSLRIIEILLTCTFSFVI